MTATDPRDRTDGPSSGYPWRSAGPVPAPDAAASPHGLPAGLVTRSLANVVDLLIAALLVGAGWLAVAAARYLVHPTGFTFPSPGGRTLLLVALGVQAVYFAVTWTVAGGTYGDRLLAVRVVGPRRTRLGWTRSGIRALLCVLFPVGLLWALVSSSDRSVQDILLGTSVLHDG